MRLSSEDGSIRCGRKGCSNTFVITRGCQRAGKNKKIYCSKRCQELAHKVRAGKMNPPSMTMRYMCRNGLHERTEETVEILKDGTRRCKPCHRDRMAEFRERKREEFGSVHAYHLHLAKA